MLKANCVECSKEDCLLLLEAVYFCALLTFNKLATQE
jgi:hypothetical protein